MSSMGPTHPPDGALEDRSVGFNPGDLGSNAGSMVQSTERGL